MKIWVDADACPVAIKNILYKAAERVKKELILVANSPLKTPDSSLIQSIVVEKGFDEADHYIAEHCEQGDLVITDDIPLAARSVEKGALALSPRGALHTEETIKDRILIRNFNDELRAVGELTGGPKPFSMRDRQNFANILDQTLRILIQQ